MNMGLFNKAKTVDSELAEYISKYFSYDPLTGLISRVDRKNSQGSLDKDGYLIIKIKRHQYKAHRIAWFLYYGVFPLFEIDHINHIRNDNRISNLREVDRATNNRNNTKKINKDTGVVGVHLDKCTDGLKKRYTTRYKGKTYRFYSLEDAISFRKSNHLIVNI